MYHHEVSQTSGDERSADEVPPYPSVAASPYWGRSTAASKPEGFSPLVGFCFTINYIVGTGFLTVPWAFSQGGLVLSTIVICVVGVFSDMAKNYMLETMARAEAMLDNQMHWIKRNAGDEEKGRLVYSPVIMKGEASDLIQSALMAFDYDSTASNNQSLHGVKREPARSSSLSLPGTPEASLHGTPRSSQPGTPSSGRRLIHKGPTKYLVKNRKFEVNSLCRVFVGKGAVHAYIGTLCLYAYCVLWAYTSVFASAMAKAAPWFADGDIDTNYLIYACIFALMVVPMSCMELDEQVIVQVMMAGARFLMLGLMLGTSSMCAQDVAHGGALDPAPIFRLSGVSKMAPILVFSHMYHPSIPGLAHPVADKKQLGGIFRSTTVFCTIAYTFIGWVLVSSFGRDIEQSSNLNWKHFTGGTAVYDNEGQIISVAPWAKFISLYVLCFPALDVVSAFPLNAITLGNNMMGSFFGRQIHEAEHNRWIRVQFRLLASIPPIVFGIFERKLGTITDYAGTTGFVIVFTVPSLLYLRSRALAKEKNYSASTYYRSSYSSSVYAAWMLFSFGIVMAVYVAYNLVRGEDKS